MKNLILYILFGAGMVLVLYLPGKFSYVEQHASLNEDAERPDIYFQNVVHYVKEHSFDRSSYHLYKAINSIKRIQEDADFESSELLESAISKLEFVQEQLINESLTTKDMLNAFEYSLNALALIELKVSEMYAETNQTDLANVALKHAQVHLKNAMLFEDSNWDSDGKNFALEKHAFKELDSLIENETISPMELTNKIDHILLEVDQLVSQE